MARSTKDPAPKRGRSKGPGKGEPGDSPPEAGNAPRTRTAKSLSKDAPRASSSFAAQVGFGSGARAPLGDDKSKGYLVGQLLIAMPTMMDPRFQRTVIFMCAHDERGAMGLVLNRLIEALTFPELLKQLGIEPEKTSQRPIHFGGPVDMGRGFVLHSDDYNQDGTVLVKPGYSVTATVDILHAIAKGEGPIESLLALGYAGWGPGQLDDEIQANGWLHAPADHTLVFDPNLESKWERAMAKIGVDLSVLSGEAGHA
ncbi:MAG: YqgE/AlgH family protein [Proteobacteria bacterium]|nr:YqgE/AlgH family protein [Pseudomonadota bacterium]MBI3496537.1 YqgE/AlgH family protein [Pseudomonadota bacterium]